MLSKQTGFQRQRRRSVLRDQGPWGGGYISIPLNRLGMDSRNGRAFWTSKPSERRLPASAGLNF